MTHHARAIDELPQIFQEVAEAWAEALEEVSFTPVQDAIRARDAVTLKSLWNQLVTEWDDRTFYDFVASSKAFSKLSFHHREVFGQVGFGTGGWDSDFPNSMLEILRVVMTNCDEDQQLIVGGAEQVPRGLWTYEPDSMCHWPRGPLWRSCTAGFPVSGKADSARPARAAVGDRSVGRHARLPGRVGDLPVLVVDHRDRL